MAGHSVAADAGGEGDALQDAALVVLLGDLRLDVRVAGGTELGDATPGLQSGNALLNCTCELVNMLHLLHFLVSCHLSCFDLTSDNMNSYFKKNQTESFQSRLWK